MHKIKLKNNIIKKNDKTTNTENKALYKIVFPVIIPHKASDNKTRVIKTETAIYKVVLRFTIGNFVK